MKNAFCLQIAVLLCLLSQSAFAGNDVEGLLHKSYAAYDRFDFKGAVLIAYSAHELARQQGDSIAMIKASFYREIARQMNENNDFDFQKLKQFIDFFSAKELLMEEARAHQHMARAYYYLGMVQDELKEYLIAREQYEALGDSASVAVIYSDMSLMYYDQHDYHEAFRHIRKAIAIDSKRNGPKAMHRNYNNLAIIYEHTGPIDSAIYFHEKALAYAMADHNAYDEGLTLSNLGLNYINKKEYKRAEDYLLRALRIRDSLGHTRGLAYTYNRLAALYIATGELTKAKANALKSLEHAEKISELKVKRMAYERLVEIAELQGDIRTAYAYFKESVALVDSLRNESNTKALTQMAMQHQFSQEQFADSAANYTARLRLEAAYEQELLREKNNRNITLGGGILMLVLAVGFYSRSRYIKRAQARLQREKERSDELLLNILPAEVAEELKEKGESEARDFDEVTVLFTDFMAFTETAQKLTAKELVTEINICFKAFDEIIGRYGIEKIKTIGDAYMAAGGLHIPRTSEPHDVVRAALEMQDFMLQRKAERDQLNLPYFNMRVGIHTGPVVAGIVGVKKFQYDIWGDTVNTASRMESMGEIERVNISQATYLIIKDNPFFQFESRGKIAVKGKGEVEMWFVLKKPE